MKPIITKEHILSEINRLAEKLNGKPPGQGTFEEETGLPSSAWKGRFWSKWSEALAEAGHTPNLVSQRINDHFIYEKLITICRHYKKRPTSAEMLLFRRTVDPDFPYLAIKSRIGIRCLVPRFDGLDLV